MFKPGDKVLLLDRGIYGWAAALMGLPRLSADFKQESFDFRDVFGVVQSINRTYSEHQVEIKIYRKRNNVQVTLAGISFDEPLHFDPASLRLIDELPSLEES